MRVLGRAVSAMLLGLALAGLGCKDVPVAPAGLHYAANPATYTVGKAITPNTPTSTGGAIDSYAVTPALPAGLALDAKSGILSGTPTTATAVATYTVTGTNAAGSTTASLSLTVVASLAITAQPADQAVLVGQTATFSVTATSGGTISYQWQKDGAAITGATAAAYTTPATVLADNGSAFSVVVTDSLGGSVTSKNALLTVTAGGPGTFTATGSLALGRTYHTATRLQSGKVLLAGGTDLSASLQTAELYDPATGTFAPTGSLVNARQKHTATLLADGRVLLVGGIVGAGGSTTLTTAELYDPATGTFALTTGNPVAARSEHTATLLPSGKVLIVSGRDQAAYVASAELFDPATGTFVLTGAPLAARATHTATLLPSGKVLVAGGFRAGALATAELFDPAGGTNGTFSATGNLATARAQHTATLLGTGQVLLVGGASTLVAELFDPAAASGVGAFAPTGSLGTARAAGHVAALLPSGMVLIAGGIGAGSPAPVLASAELFDPAAATFAATGSLAAAREHATATVLTSGKVLVAAGDTGTVLATVEIYY